MSTIHHEFTTSASAQAIYDALTTPAGLRGWWAKDCDISERVGDSQELRFIKGDRSVTMRFRIEQLEPNRVQWHCTDNGNPAWVGSTLVWSLDETKGSRVMRFEHRDLAMTQGPPYTMTVEGWPGFIQSLQRYVEGGVGAPL